MKTWFITGCSTGLGRAFAGAALARGDNVVATARDPSTIAELAQRYPDTALALALDVTDDDQITQAHRAAVERFGGVDILINNAGYGYRAAVEEGELDQVHQLFATNFRGPVALIGAVLPRMRARGSGTIVNISSIAARASPPGSGFYAATKAALEAMTLSLRRELAPLGITAMVVEPGGFRTDFSGRSLAQSAEAIDDYAETAGRRRKERDTTDGTQPGDPDRAAAALIEVIESPEPPFMLVLGRDALGRLRDELADLDGELSRWEHITLGTDFPTETAS